MNFTPRPRVALIAAVAANGVIGRNGQLPWHLPADLQHFKALTSGKRILMGRRTWESFPKPLPNREHVVISSRALSLPDGVHLTRSLTDALALPGATAPVFIIGGNALYAEALTIADDLYLTEIAAVVEGDTVFPAWPRAQFDEISRQTWSAPLSKDTPPVDGAFVHYMRRPT